MLFRSVDHHILLKRLEQRAGICDSALAWIKSYLSDRSQYVKLDGTASKSHKLQYGVPQGSVLGPLLFILCTLPLGDIVRRHGLSFHFYADDSQI